MTTCEICDCVLDGKDIETPVRLEKDAYYVCGYTCETVLYETDFDHAIPTRHSVTP